MRMGSGRYTMRAARVLLDHGRDHKGLAHKQLVLDAARPLVIAKLECERLEVEVIGKCRLHKLAVEIGEKRVAQLHDVAHGVDVLERVELLCAAARGVVAQ